MKNEDFYLINDYPLSQLKEMDNDCKQLITAIKKMDENDITREVLFFIIERRVLIKQKIKKRKKRTAES
jgi:hypothetical protein